MIGGKRWGWGEGYDSLAKTIDGGESYIPQNTGTTKYLTSVFFTDSHTGYIAGDSGVIMKTTNVGGPSTGIEDPEDISSKYKVQSYPNPTHGIVDFRLSVSDGQWKMDNAESTILKVYNAQGQEVAVVLDEKLPAGEHTVQWNTSGLPAGIYYYQLKAEGAGQGGAGRVVKFN
jgi:hypothetical protein